MYREPLASTAEVGYYIHHHGSGHLHRAEAIAECWDRPVTGLSTAPRPRAWRGDWVRLDDDAGGRPDQNLTANGSLHYVPEGHPGLRARMATVSEWIAANAPAALVVDVSVEVALLARLHGVPVVSVAMPGRRTDRVHRLGYDLSDAILAPWPAAAHGIWAPTATDLGKTTFLGAVSRFTPVGPSTPVPGRVVVLNGTGGPGPGPSAVAAARAATPGWEWFHLDRAHGTWVDEPWPLLCSASVIISHTGQNAVAEIAAARRPAVLIPQDRPHHEQRTTGSALAKLGWVPAVVRHAWPDGAEWLDLLDQVATLDGQAWSGWNDGQGAARAAAALTALTAVTAVTAYADPAVFA